MPFVPSSILVTIERKDKDGQRVRKKGKEVFLREMATINAVPHFNNLKIWGRCGKCGQRKKENQLNML